MQTRVHVGIDARAPISSGRGLLHAFMLAIFSVYDFASIHVF